MNKALKNIKTDPWDRFFSKKKRFRFLTKVKTELISNLNKLKFKRNKNFRFKLKKLLFRLGKKDFRKESFIRTKRKSFYGRSLIEKKKIQLLTVNLKLKSFYLKYKHKFVSKIKSRADFILNTLNIFGSPYSLKRNLVYKKSIFTDNNYVLNIGDCLSFISNYNFSKKRIIPSNFHFDIRIYKIFLVNDKFKNASILKHYRIKND